MKFYGVCPASCGEFVQGFLDNEEYLSSYAINLFSVATLEEGKEIIQKGPKKSRRAMELVFEKFGLPVDETKNISLNIKSKIPVGKGMASSTADIGATIKATLSMLNKTLTGEEISKLAVKIEATDSLLLNQHSIFNPLTADIKKYLGGINDAKVVILEPSDILDTKSIRMTPNYKTYKMQNKEIIKKSFELLDEACDVEFFASDGDRVEKGQLLGRVKGDVRILLSGERVALNYLQRMSGIATYTANVQEYLKDSSIRLLDTRKTTPNNRIFEKYAVRVGGGHNHRYNLSDGVLLKDNHIGAAGGVKEAIMLAKEYAPFVRKIEIEVENMEMVKEAVEAGADIIMLDNMDDDMLKEAIAYIDHRAEIEVSGNVTKENIARLTNLGVDYVSSGALTHSAPIMDISLKNLHRI